MAASNEPEQVPVHVKGRGVQVTPSLRDHVSRKMQRLSRYLDRLQTIDVILTHERTREADTQHQIEAVAHVPGRTLTVKSAGPDMLTAVDDAVDKLYRQLNRKKERMKGHHGPRTEPIEIPVLEDEEPEAISVERVDAKPMFEEEAAALLDEGNRPFVVFLNARNEQINVLYRKPNGLLALVEPGA
ncbi:MAG TPA: ribosome-associated translation inhibitor RaiA [Chloroflexota bacterium]|nr:ribosome-associated translation inhibitor RaiA [Chloroflexota bacterium]